MCNNYNKHYMITYNYFSALHIFILALIKSFWSHQYLNPTCRHMSPKYSVIERWSDDNCSSRICIFCWRDFALRRIGGGWAPKRALLIVRPVADCTDFNVDISSYIFGWHFLTNLLSALCQSSSLLLVLVPWL